MATTLLVGDVLSLTTWVQLGQQAGLNVGGFRVKSIVGTPTLENVVNQFDLTIAPSLTAFMSSQASFKGTIGRRVTNPPSAQVLSQSIPAPGTGSAVVAPGQVAGIITLTTGLAGRANRGRKYIPFVDHALLADAYTLTPAGVSKLEAIAAVWVGELTFPEGANSVTLSPCVLHRNGFTLSPTIVGHVSRTRLATQRRRGAYGRPNVPPF